MKKFTINWLQINQDSKEDLSNEFFSLINDDKDFHYNKNEFLDWVYDYHINI